MFGFFEPRKTLRSFEARGMFGCTSRTVSYASELMSVSTCYLQGDGFHTSLSRLMYYTHASLPGCVTYFLCVLEREYKRLVCCVWLSSVARSYAARDDSNKDNVCTPTISAGINRPPPSETISHIPRVPSLRKMANQLYGESTSTSMLACDGILSPCPSRHVRLLITNNAMISYSLYTKSVIRSGIFPHKKIK